MCGGGGVRAKRPAGRLSPPHDRDGEWMLAERSGRRRHHKQQQAEAAEIHGQKLNSANFIDLGNARRRRRQPLLHNTHGELRQNIYSGTAEGSTAQSSYSNSNRTAPDSSSTTSVAV